jgi:hypothetical protein
MYADPKLCLKLGILESPPEGKTIKISKNLLFKEFTYIKIILLEKDFIKFPLIFTINKKKKYLKKICKDIKNGNKM